MLKKRLSRSRKLAALPNDSSRFLYCMIMPHLDAEGRYDADPVIIKGHILPYIEDWTFEKIGRELKSLAAQELITLYEIDGEQYLQYMRFHDFNRIDPKKEAKSSIPAPNPEQRQSSAGVTPGKVKGSISKSKSKEKDNIYVNLERLTVDSWNSLCEKYPILSKVINVSDKRRSHLKRRFESAHFRDHIAEAIGKIGESKFLRGENDREWRASFDWLISNDNNYVKILEGRYKDKPKSLLDQYKEKK